MSGELLVRGGEGGIAVNLAELAELGDLLRDAARSLGFAEAALTTAMIRLRHGAELAPTAGARALTALENAAAHTAAITADVDGLAVRARQARDVYERAEWTALELVDRALSMRWLPLPLPLPRLDELLQPVGWAIALDLRAWPLEMRVAGEPDRSAAAPSGARDLITGIDALYPAVGGEAGSLEVRRIEQPDGAISWAVLVPGTQTLAVGGANPMDNATNLQEYVGVPSGMAAAVLAALGAAGARRGQPVLLAGHSQGGLVAMRLAAQPEFRRRYDVTTVLTAGSPVGHLPTPSGVSVLHLEHSGDVVPALDAAVNPDEPDRTTVWHAGSGPAAPEVAGGAMQNGGGWADPERHPRVAAGGAHDASSYARTAALVDDSVHPSIVAWRERAAEVLGADGATATSTVYVAERQDPLVLEVDPASSRGPQRDGGAG